MKKASKKGATERTFGAWKGEISGVDYVKKIRGDSEKRLKRLKRMEL